MATEAPYIELPAGAPPGERYLTTDEVQRLIIAAQAPHFALGNLLDAGCSGTDNRHS